MRVSIGELKFNNPSLATLIASAKQNYGRIEVRNEITGQGDSPYPNQASSSENGMSIVFKYVRTTAIM